MKYRFIGAISILLLIFLFISVLFVYSALKQDQKHYQQVLEPLIQDTRLPQDIHRSLSIQRELSDSHTLAITRKTFRLFLIEIIILILILSLVIIGILRPVSKLSLYMQTIDLSKPQTHQTLIPKGSTEIRYLIESTNNLICRLEEYEKEIGDLSRYRGWKEISRIIVHEVNNLLSPIRTYAEYLIEKPSDTAKLNLIVNKLNEIRQVLSKYRTLAHLPEVQITKIDLNPIITEISREFPETKVLQNTEKLLVLSDPILLKEILRNLVKNAHEADQTTKITLELIPNPPCIKVQDNGCGMDSAVLNKIFTPNFSTKNRGSGIGLSIVQHLTSELHIELHCESASGEGTCFTLTFQNQSEVES